MRQKLVWCRRDLHIPPQLIEAIRYPDVDVVDRILEKNPELGWAENVLATVCRVPGFEGHGGQIPDAEKRQLDRVKLVRAFLKHGADPNLRNKRKVTPLHMSCRFDLPRVANFLLQQGAEPNAYDEVRETPLYRAVNLGYASCVEILLKYDVDLDFQNRKGQTVLHRAAIRGKRFIVPLLLDAGASVELQDRAGKVPLDYARNELIKQMLSESRS